MRKGRFTTADEANMHLRPGIHQLLCEQIPEYLRFGNLPAWEIENKLAKLFKVTDEELSKMYPNTNTPVWRNDVFWALSELVQAGKISNLGNKPAPKGMGGRRGVYMLNSSSTGAPSAV